MFKSSAFRTGLKRLAWYYGSFLFVSWALHLLVFDEPVKSWFWFFMVGAVHLFSVMMTPLLFVADRTPFEETAAARAAWEEEVRGRLVDAVSVTVEQQLRRNGLVIMPKPVGNTVMPKPVGNTVTSYASSKTPLDDL